MIWGDPFNIRLYHCFRKRIKVFEKKFFHIILLNCYERTIILKNNYIFISLFLSTTYIFNFKFFRSKLLLGIFKTRKKINFRYRYLLFITYTIKYIGKYLSEFK